MNTPTYDPALDDHREGRVKAVNELAAVIARYWVHNGDDTVPQVTASDLNLAQFILANYALRRSA